MVYLEDILNKYPEFLESEDLVKLGLYKTIDATYQARLKKYGPPYVKMRKKILYPKRQLIEWLEQKQKSKNI